MNEAESKERELQRMATEAAAPRGAGAPRDCGHFDIHIDRNGSWFYRGTPINRMSLVRLFSTVLERDEDGVYWLTTPAERGRITVEDVPFLAVALEQQGAGSDQRLIFRTNLDDFVTLDSAHPLRIETDSTQTGPRPYILVRNRLEARLSRPVFYDLVALGREERVGDTIRFGVWSKGTFFPLGQLTDGA